MQLSFFELQQAEGKVVVAPLSSVLEQGALRWNCCLVGFILDNKLSFSIVRSIALRMWAREGLYEVLAQGKGFFYFCFSKETGLSAVLEGGLWLIAGRHVFLRRWQQGLKLFHDSVDKIPVWIQLHDVPLEYWTAEGLSYLSSAVGLPLYADSATENYRRVNFARICVELMLQSLCLRSLKQSL